MFRKRKNRTIETDAGFSVEQVSFDKLVYREGEKEVTLTAEPLVGAVSFVLYLAEYSDCWDPPFETVRISDEHWVRIGENIREAYRSQGTETEVWPLAPQAQRDALRRGIMELRDNGDGPAPYRDND